MQAILQNTDPPQPGHALLVLSQIKNSGLPGDAGIIVQRAANRQFLGKNGWQDTQANLSPLTARYGDSGELLLKIGPEIVDYLDAGDNYRLYLSWPEQPLQLAGLKVDDISYSTYKQQKNEIDAIQAGEQRYMDAAPETPDAPVSMPPEPGNEGRHESAPSGQATDDDRRPAWEDRTAYQQGQEDEEEHSVGSVLSSAMVLIGVMFLIAVLLYFFL